MGVHFLTGGEGQYKYRKKNKMSLGVLYLRVIKMSLQFSTYKIDVEINIEVIVCVYMYASQFCPPG